MSFPNGSSAGLHGISIQTLRDLTAKSNGQTGLNFLRALTNLVNVILEGKVPFELRSYLFGAKLIALKKPDGGLRPIAFRKRCWIPCLRITSSKIWKSTSRCRHQKGHCIGLTCFPLFDRKAPAQRKLTLRTDFKNAFKSINRQFMLENIFELHPEVYKYSHSAYSQPIFLFYSDSVIKSCVETQQGNPESLGNI